MKNKICALIALTVLAGCGTPEPDVVETSTSALSPSGPATRQSTNSYNCFATDWYTFESITVGVLSPTSAIVQLGSVLSDPMLNSVSLACPTATVTKSGDWYYNSAPVSCRMTWHQAGGSPHTTALVLGASGVSVYDGNGVNGHSLHLHWSGSGIPPLCGPSTPDPQFYLP